MIVSIVETIDRGIVRDSFTPDCGMLEDRQLEERRDCAALKFGRPMLYGSWGSEHPT
jgi:hypothetical protein